MMHIYEKLFSERLLSHHMCRPPYSKLASSPICSLNWNSQWMGRLLYLLTAFPYPTVVPNSPLASNNLISVGSVGDTANDSMLTNIYIYFLWINRLLASSFSSRQTFAASLEDFCFHFLKSMISSFILPRIVF